MDLTLPYVSLQADYSQAYTDVEQSLHDFEKVWLSAYCQNAPDASIHTKLLLSSTRTREVEVEVDPAGSSDTLIRIEAMPAFGMDFRIASTSKDVDHSAKMRRIKIAFEPITMRIPKRAIGPVVKGHMGVTAFDLAGNRYVAGGSDGQVYIGYIDAGVDTQSEEMEREGYANDIERLAQSRIRNREREIRTQSKTQLKGHVGDIRSARFFPSGQVVLTTSSDCTARVFGLDGNNPRTLKGHRRGITSSCIIDKGREVLTCSSDGTTRLWDLSQGLQKRSFTAYKYSSINSITIGGRSGADEGDGSKTILTGLTNGYIEGHDLSSGQSIFCIPPISFPRNANSEVASVEVDHRQQVKSGGIESIDWNLDGHVILAGCSNGVTMQYDDRMISANLGELDSSNQSHITSWRRNAAAINHINLVEDGKEAIISTADGTPYRVDIATTPRVVEEYNGWDVDNVQASSIDERGRVWLAGADGMIRMYGR